MNNYQEQEKKKLGLIKFKKRPMLKTTIIARKNEGQPVSRSKKNHKNNLDIDAAELNHFIYNEKSGKYLKIVKNFIIAFYVKRFIRTVR